MPRTFVIRGAVAIMILFATAPTWLVAQTIIVPTDGTTCSTTGSARRDNPCAAGSWCEPRPGKCTSGSTGMCVRVPQVCTMIFKPVCGCDGRTYGNDCDRRAQRVGKKHDGEC